jgi:hypothetical protein
MPCSGHLRFVTLTGEEVKPGWASTRIQANTTIEWYFTYIAEAIEQDLGSFVFQVDEHLVIPYVKRLSCRTQTHAAELLQHPGDDLDVYIIATGQGQ